MLNKSKQTLILEIQDLLNSQSSKEISTTYLNPVLMQELDIQTLMQIKDNLLSKKDLIHKEWLFELREKCSKKMS